MKSLSGLSGLYVILADAAISQNPGMFPGDDPSIKTVHVTLTKAMVNAIASVTGSTADLSASVGASFTLSLGYVNNQAKSFENEAKITDTDSGTVITIDWNSAKTYTGITMTSPGQTLNLYYDDIKKQTLLNLNGASPVFMGMQEIPTGVLFVLISGTSSIKGIADNNGGYINMMSGASVVYDEYFDASGKVTDPASPSNIPYSIAAYTAELAALNAAL